MKKLAIAAAFTVAATALLAQAQQAPKPEDHLKWRKASYSLMGLHFGSLAAMAQDKKPYNKEEAIRDADFVALLATEPRGHFGEGTEKLEGSKAKPENWQKRQDFDQKMDKMVSETAKLPQVARNGDLAALKKAVADTGGACKACHDDYRAK
jgi:cytochrome c556